MVGKKSIDKEIQFKIHEKTWGKKPVSFYETLLIIQYDQHMKKFLFKICLAEKNYVSCN